MILNFITNLYRRLSFKQKALIVILLFVIFLSRIRVARVSNDQDDSDNVADEERIPFELYSSIGLKEKDDQYDSKQIKKAYRRMAARYFPDRVHTEDEVFRFKQIALAFEILSNEKLRKIYDKEGYNDALNELRRERKRKRKRTAEMEELFDKTNIMIHSVYGRNSPLRENMLASKNHHTKPQDENSASSSSSDDNDSVNSLPPLRNFDNTTVSSQKSRQHREKSARGHTQKLLDYLREITYKIPDTDEPQSHDMVQNTQSAFQAVPISSMYVDTRPVADQVSLYNHQLGTKHHAYIKSRASTAITLFPILTSMGIKTVAQLRRISAKEIDTLKRALFRSGSNVGDSSIGGGASSAGTALFYAFLAKIQQDSVELSTDGLEVLRSSAEGSGCDVRCDVHRNIGISQDSRPLDHSLRWHRKKTEYTVLCKECAPSAYKSDIESRVEKKNKGLVCPQPPWVMKKKRIQRAMMMHHQQEEQKELSLYPRPPSSSSMTSRTGQQHKNNNENNNSKNNNSYNNNNTSSDRLFEPKPNPTTGRYFVPRLTTLQHSLLPASILPEDSDEITWNQHQRKKVKAMMGNAKSLGDILGIHQGTSSSGGNQMQDDDANADTYDPFRCRSAMTFTMDEIAVTTKICNAVKEVMHNQWIRANNAARNADNNNNNTATTTSGSAPAGNEPFVDATQTVISSSVVGQAFASLGVDPRALQAVTGAISRGRLGSAMMGSRRGSSAGGSSYGGGSIRRASASRSSFSSATMRKSGTFGGRSGTFGGGGGTSGGNNDASFSSMSRRRSSAGGFSARRMSTMSANSTSAADSPTRKRGATVADLAQWIEQRLDAPKFLKQIFCRFSRSTPWIVFRHEIDEAIRSRVTGIELILQMMNESNADILPFEKFASEAGKGKSSIAFTEQFLPDAIRFIAENSTGRGIGGGGGSGLGSRKGSSMTNANSNNHLRRAGSSIVSSR